MGVLLHPSTKNERANGVAISRDVLYQTEDQVGQRFYLNVQEGENLVTNPEIGTAPDELLISPRNPRTDQIIRQVGRRILSADHLRELRRSLRVIHFRFQELYEVPPGKDFAMEIEFKVTKNGRLFIKQARPWVYR